MRISVEEGQISLFDLQMEVKPKEVEVFKITDEEITEVLLNRYKKDIYIHFINEPYNNEIFLRDQYGIGGKHGYVLKEYKLSDVDYNSNGLRIQKQDGNRRAEITLTWSQVSNRIEKLIKENRYLNKEEIIKYGLNEVFEINDEDIQRVLMFKNELGSIEKRIKVYKNFISNGYKCICSKEFLKEAYGTSGSIRGKTSKGIRYSDNYKENGIEIEKGKVKMFMPWISINVKLYKLIRNNIFLTYEEKKKYGLLISEDNYCNEMYESIIIQYKDICSWISKNEHGLMVKVKGRAMFYDCKGHLKYELEGAAKKIGEVLIDNTVSDSKNTILDKKVTKVATKSTDMDKKITESDIEFTKGQAVKVCLGGKERIGEVWRLQSNGCVSVLFKDTNSIGAYPRKFIKAVKEKLKIRLLEDCTDIKNDFLKGNVYEVWMEQPENYIIRIDGVAYGPLKKSCEIV